MAVNSRLVDQRYRPVQLWTYDGRASSWLAPHPQRRITAGATEELKLSKKPACTGDLANATVEVLRCGKMRLRSG
jgi:hypothetical protein